MQTIKLGQVRYNGAIGAFEARVDIERDSGVFRYPCQFAAPATADDDQVRLGLVRHALRMSDTPIPSDRPQFLM